jgi:hypothetical protein
MRPQHAVVMRVICLALVAAGADEIPEYGSASQEGGYG